MENWRVSGVHKLKLHRSIAHRGLVLPIKHSSLFENGSDRQVWVGVVVKGCDA